MKVAAAFHVLRAFGACLSTLPVLAGCVQVRAVGDCNTIAEDVNPVLDAIEAEHKKPPSPGSYELIAKQYESIAEKLSARRFEDPAMTKAVDDYRAVLNATAKNAHTFATALGGKDTKKLAAIRVSQAQQNNKERNALRRLHSLCGPG